MQCHWCAWYGARPAPTSQLPGAGTSCWRPSRPRAVPLDTCTCQWAGSNTPQVSSLALAASTATANALIARRQGTLAQAATSTPPPLSTSTSAGAAGGATQEQQQQAAGSGDVPLAVLQGWVLEAVNVAAAAAGPQAEAAHSLGAGNVGISEFSTR